MKAGYVRCGACHEMRLKRALTLYRRLLICAGCITFWKIRDDNAEVVSK
jgi:formylmethanofuran dehydrogenase subunit E